MRLERSLEQWAGGKPAVIAEGSKAQMMYFIEDAQKDIAALAREVASKDAEIERLQAQLSDWQPISTCPFRETVDLWCVYGGEEFAQYDGGAPIGRLISARNKSEEYGFFGNQSNDGVPQRDAPDLVPVAWRKAVPFCPPSIIAQVLGVPLTCEDALKGGDA